jgi:hypothetical protein
VLDIIFAAESIKYSESAFLFLIKILIDQYFCELKHS